MSWSLMGVKELKPSDLKSNSHKPWVILTQLWTTQPWMVTLPYTHMHLNYSPCVAKVCKICKQVYWNKGKGRVCTRASWLAKLRLLPVSKWHEVTRNISTPSWMECSPLARWPSLPGWREVLREESILPKNTTH